MKFSIKSQMIFVYAGLIVFMLVVFVIANGQFLESYHIESKKNEYEEVYRILKDLVEEGEISTENAMQNIRRLEERGNISVALFLNDNGRLYPQYMSDNREGDTMKLVKGYIFKQPSYEELKTEKNTENYEILKVRDNDTQLEYIDMWGTMGIYGEYYFVLRSSIESIRNNVALSNRFLIYVGSMITCVSLWLIWFFARKIANPILELAHLSQKMASLDFEAKYTSGGKNEIGVLGQNFNTMSDKLEETISDLKNANHELKKDIEKKEKLENMRTEFIANISHELKTPIALIQGYAEGLHEGIDSDMQMREFYCNVIIDEAVKMNQMVKKLLELDQAESGGNVKYERFDIMEVIRGIINSNEILIRQKEIEVTIDQKEKVYIWGDEFKIEQVVQNYITNAINHVDEKKFIEIKAEKKEETAKISVFNTGQRIPEEELENIWEKFYKIDKSHSREYGGNGIGLSIVKAIMDSMNQQYGVKNYDNGVEFWFELSTK